MYVVGTLVGLAAAAAPEITADGDDLILAALGGELAHHPSSSFFRLRTLLGATAYHCLSVYLL